MEDENENEMENGNELKSDIQMEPNDGPIIEMVEKKEKENEREHQNEVENEIQNGVHNGKEESVKNKKNVELENQNETKLNGIGNSNGEIEINTIRKSTIVKKKSYQFRALSRKTLSYQVKIFCSFEIFDILQNQISLIILTINRNDNGLQIFAV